MTSDPRDGMARFMEMVNGFGNGTLKIDSLAGLQSAAASLSAALEDFIANDLPGIRLKAKAAHVAVCYTPTFIMEPMMKPYAKMVRDISRDEIENKMKSAVTALASGDVLKQAGDAAQAHAAAENTGNRQYDRLRGIAGENPACGGRSRDRGENAARCCSVAGGIAPGPLVRRTAPGINAYFFGFSVGKQMTSRMLPEFVSSIVRRSMLRPRPPVGGRPYSSAAM